MDKVKAEAAAKVQNAKVEEVTDANGLKAVKLTFDSGLQFDLNKSTLRAAAKKDLTNFASVLKNNTDCLVDIQGYTDATGGDNVLSNDALLTRLDGKALQGHHIVHALGEDGASVYSASKIARDEFPDHDVTVRGAVSIARRLADPLAELVKIDPKAIGVGQYQHDVDQAALKHSLDQTVESCVNAVGVNLNTASQHLLTYVSGLGPA